MITIMGAFRTAVSIGVLCVLATSAYGQAATRPHVLRSGEIIDIPQNAIAVPGEPLIIPGLDTDSVARAGAKYEKRGYIDRSNDDPTPEIALRHMMTKIETEGLGDQSQIYRFRDGEVATGYPLGRVEDQFLNIDTEAFYAPGINTATRIYTNTEFGTLLINEQFGEVELGEITGMPPNFSVAGYEGYRIQNRYSRGRMTTVIIMKTSTGAAHLEFTTDPSNESFSSRAESMIEGFVTNVMQE